MGMKQRIGLAQALIHKPKLLVLDEPTNGLDPNGIHEFRDIVKGLAKEKNISVLISSHLISEVQLMCDSVSIINNGSIIKNASINEVLSTGEVVWVLDDCAAAKKILKEKFDIDASIISGKLSALVDFEKLAKVNKFLIDSGVNLQLVENRKRTLEDLFEGMSLYFSITILSIWAIASLIIAFEVFKRKDVLV